MMQTCGGCAAFEATDAEFGYCHRRPPSSKGFRQVLPTDWCLDFVTPKPVYKREDHYPKVEGDKEDESRSSS
jgi:hypothetical protein